MTEDLEVRIEQRKRQAIDRRITEKAIAVVNEHKPSKNPDDLNYIFNKFYCDTKINIYYDKRCSKKFIRISVDQLAVYEDLRFEQKFNPKEECPKRGPNLFGISTYVPGDWEAHLDGLYRRIPEHRKVRLQKEEEERIKKEQQEKNKDIEYKKRCFGL